MKLKLVGTGTLIDVNDSYGARLIEQGQAVKVPEPKKPAAKPAPEKKG